MKNFKIELLKFKNSSAMYTLFLSPLLFLVFAIFTSLFAQQSPNKSDISPYVSITFNLWPFFIIPIISCIVANSFINMEIQNHLFNYYKGNNWSINKTIKNKIMITIIGFAIHSLIMFIIALLGDFLVGGNYINPFLLLITILLIFYTSLPLIPLNFILVKNLGVFVSIFLNIMLSIVSIITLTLTKVYWLIPWANIGRIPLITLSLHPNGTVLSKNNEYFNDLNSLLIVLISSTIYFIIFFFLNNKNTWRIK